MSRDMPLRQPKIGVLGIVKSAAAAVNRELDCSTRRTEVASGQHDADFPSTFFKPALGTSTNMNTNEVIAKRARQVIDNQAVHPNDHVNMCQSSHECFLRRSTSPP